jgi:hypothetical protein
MVKNLLLFYLGYEYLRARGWFQGAKAVGDDTGEFGHFSGTIDPCEVELHTIIQRGAEKAFPEPPIFSAVPASRASRAIPQAQNYFLNTIGKKTGQLG